MSPLSSIVLAAVGLSLGASAANTHVIVVGKEGQTFTNGDVKANVGDILEFRFWAANHSVVQGNWQTACQPHEDGFYSGFNFPTEPGAPNKDVFQVVLEDTEPKVFYCSQGKHCINGMVGVVNGLGNRTFEVYKELAAEAETVGNPPGGNDVKGGEIVPLQANSSPTPSSGSGNGGGDNTSPTDSANNADPSQTGNNNGSGAGSVGVSLGALVAAGLFAVALV